MDTLLVVHFGHENVNNNSTLICAKGTSFFFVYDTFKFITKKRKSEYKF